MPRKSETAVYLNESALAKGVTQERIASAVAYVHDTLDTLDQQLLTKGLPRMTGLVELANLSSIIGNIFSSGFVAAAEGDYSRAGPHKYQDLRTTRRDPDAVDIEVKVALEKNNPKGHLAKEGDYITCRYILAGRMGSLP